MSRRGKEERNGGRRGRKSGGRQELRKVQKSLTFWGQCCIAVRGNRILGCTIVEKYLSDSVFFVLFCD